MSPRTWTTKVNVALVVAVSAVFLIGLIYAVYAVMNTSDVQQDVHDDVTLPLPRP